MTRRVLLWLTLALLVMGAVAALRALPWAWWDPGDREREPGEVGSASELDSAVRGDAYEAGPRLEGAVRQVPTGRPTVRVLGQGGVPLPGTTVRFDGPSNPCLPAVGRTDAEGLYRAEVAVPFDGRIRASIEDGAEAAILGPVTVIRSDRGLPCEVVGVHAVTGTVVEGVSWNASSGILAVSGLRVPTCLHFTSPRRAGRQVLPLRPGQTAYFEWEATPPEGMQVWPAAEPERTISRYAASLSIRQPLYPEADVEVRILDAPGRGLEDVEKVGWALSPATGPGDGPSVSGMTPWTGIAGDRIRVQGIPFVPGARLALWVEALDLPPGGEIQAHLARGAWPLDRRMRVTLRFPPEPDASDEDAPFEAWVDNTAIGIGGRRGSEAPPPPGPGSRWSPAGSGPRWRPNSTGGSTETVVRRSRCPKDSAASRSSSRGSYRWRPRLGSCKGSPVTWSSTSPRGPTCS